MMPTFYIWALLSVSLHSTTAQNYVPYANLFIGTGSDGNAFPGAATPNGMAKVGIDVDTSPRQAGYKAGNYSVTGISLMHDEGTGGNAGGGYGIFPLFPLRGCDYTSCPVKLADRKTLRIVGDEASPGYFASTLTTGIKMEATSTRRAGLIRFTYPPSSTSNHIVVDLTNDLQRSFHGGSLQLDTSKGRIELAGTYMQSYGTFNYTAYACYDFKFGSQTFLNFGTYNGATITPNSTTLNYPYATSGYALDSGVLLSFQNSSTVTSRFGISMLSSAQACANAEEEIPMWDWEATRTASEQLWKEKLAAIQIDVENEDPKVVTLLYSSLYRTALVPANMTQENPYSASKHPFFDSLFCSWDTFRTEHPLLSLLWPHQWSQIVSSYVDGWRQDGFIPECRANTKAGYVQGGSNGMPILGDFAVKYGSSASQLGVDIEDLYASLVDTAEKTPSDWYRYGRQNDVWKRFGYIPFNRCNGKSKANGPCTTAADCGDVGLSLCGSDGFVCLNKQCKKKSGAYCAADLNECLPGRICRDGNPYIGTNYKPHRCSAGSEPKYCDEEYNTCVTDMQPNPDVAWCEAVRQQCLVDASGREPDGSTRAATGLATREVSRSLEYAFNDFAVRQAAIALEKLQDVEIYTNRSMNFKNLWDASVNYDGFIGYVQKRYQNGTFEYTPPDACSPVDSGSHSCARGDDNDTGFYESSSYEYSFWAPHSVSSIVRLMGGPDTFIRRLDRYFDRGYFYPGNEPSFGVPWLYHYANRPDLSAKRVRKVVYEKSGTDVNGLPGNDDSGSMTALLVFHLLGLYPIPATNQLLLGSPFLSKYTINNNFFGTSTTISVKGFDSATLTANPPSDSRLYVQRVSINGIVSESICWISFEDITGGGTIEIEVDASVPEQGCGTASSSLPDSLENGGFSNSK